jgi:rubrerythrin
MNNIEEALKTALSMEKTGYDLYMKAAKKTSNKLGRSTLEAIASKELDHINAIEQFASKELNKAIESINPMSKKDYVRSIMDKLAKELDENIKPDSDLEKAYKAAMGLEKSSYDLYRDLAEKSTDSQAKKFFEFLMGEENNHYQLLSETLEYLNKPANWFREQEKWVIEG